MDIAGAAMLTLALLLPVGDAPWVSFWREWAASIATLVIVLGAVGRLRAERATLRLELLSLPGLALGLAVVPWLQWLAGIEFYRGDAMLVSAYLVAFACCICIAQSIADEERRRLADRLAFAMLVAALCSLPLAVLQWAGLLRLDLGMAVAAGRPVAHMEQTNLLCSLLIQGLLGAWRLHSRGRLGSGCLSAIAVGLLLTMDLTQSRVAWLVLAAVAIAWISRRKALGLPMCHAWMLCGSAVILAGGLIAMPWIDGKLGLTGVALADRLTGGRRPDAWALFLDAVTVHPWVGWGALQNGAAQFAMALRHPELFWLFSSAHDVVLDLMIWFGAPLGLLAGGTLFVAVILRVRQAPDAPSLLTAMSAVALLMHGLVELPLQYTYFLFPLGLMIGLVGPVKRVGTRAFSFRLKGVATFAMVSMVPTLFLALLAADYVPLSDVRPFMDYDKPADHMLLGAAGDVPDVYLLDQLQAFHIFSAQQAAAGLTANTLTGLRKPLLRFPFAPSQEHYAHIMAINGHEAEASDALKRSCKFMTVPQCNENHRAWKIWRELGQPLPAWP
jgi:hypothetical protein